MSPPSAAQKAARFRQLHERGIFVGNAWDAGLARILAGLGFEAIRGPGDPGAGTFGDLDSAVTSAEIGRQMRQG